MSYTPIEKQNYFSDSIPTFKLEYLTVQLTALKAFQPHFNAAIP